MFAFRRSSGRGTGTPVLILMLLLAALVPLARAADAPLSLAEAQKRAVARSQQLPAQDSTTAARRRWRSPPGSCWTRC